jgi:hypothetical protein
MIFSHFLVILATLWIVLGEMESANRGADGGVNNGDLVLIVLSGDNGNKRLLIRQLNTGITHAYPLNGFPSRCGRQVDVNQAPTRICRILRDHLSCRRPTGVHAFIVKNDPHPAPGCFLNREPHIGKELAAHPLKGARKSGPWMKNKGMHAVRLKIIELPGNLGLTELIIPEPEWRMRIFS